MIVTHHSGPESTFDLEVFFFVGEILKIMELPGHE